MIFIHTRILTCVGVVSMNKGWVMIIVFQRVILDLGKYVFYSFTENSVKFEMDNSLRSYKME